VRGYATCGNPYLELRTALVAERIGDGGPDTTAVLTDGLDRALTELAADIGPGAAIVALGGYGRREQCVWSDVDVLLLHRGVETDPLVRSVLYPLWDADLKVGHAVRTVAENQEAAREHRSAWR
jgi:[protein-PII] uridylyltransferase